MAASQPPRGLSISHPDRELSGGHPDRGLIYDPHPDLDYQRW